MCPQVMEEFPLGRRLWQDAFRHSGTQLMTDKFISPKAFGIVEAKKCEKQQLEAYFWR